MKTFVFFLIFIPSFAHAVECGPLVQTFWKLDKNKRTLIQDGLKVHNNRTHCLRTKTAGTNAKVKVLDKENKLLVEQYIYIHNAIFYDYLGTDGKLTGGVKTLKQFPVKINFISNKSFKKRKKIVLHDSDGKPVASGSF